MIDIKKLETLLLNLGIEFKIDNSTLTMSINSEAVVKKKSYNEGCDFDLICTMLNDCDSIKTLNMAQSRYCPNLFADLIHIESIVLPLQCVVFPRFKNCCSLSNIATSNVEIIGPRDTSSDDRIFNKCHNLNKIKFNKNLRLLNSYAFFCSDFNFIDLSDCSKLIIEERAFMHCSKLERIILPSHIDKLKDYTFFGCKDLKFIEGCNLTSICRRTFGECFSLEVIPFFVDIAEYEKPRVNRFPRNRKFNLNFFFEKDYYDSSQTGIVLHCDGRYSYIWSFKNFHFYCIDKVLSKLINEFVTFKHDYSISPRFKNNSTHFTPMYNLYRAINIKKICNTSDIGMLCGIAPYHISRYGDMVDENNQRLAIDDVFSNNKYRDQPILDVVNKITSMVNSLDVNNIIDSYHTDVEEHTITKIGGDDRFYSSITRRSNYSDEYLKTLLPDKSTFYSDYGYTSPFYWPWTTKEKRRSMDEEDALTRADAISQYSKIDHINCLLGLHVNRLIREKINLEKYCHIESVKMLFAKHLGKSTGFELISKLNKICELYYGDGDL